ncbi:MAG: orotidine 5'-phosphate decarboxylase / HUMPS family protein [bacterium]|nr:orotidine 5'-phosphate decarboxylase / HUMPS family protein [bacterium]
MRPFLWIALDALLRKEAETLKLAESLAKVDGDFGFKINLDYFLLRDIEKVVANFAGFGRPLFADLKMWNGNRTMMDAVEALAGKVTYVNIYALADEMLTKTVAKANESGIQVLGITVLTHYNDAYCQKHFRRSLPETVRHLSDTALERGCHGVILPGTTLNVVSDLTCKKMVPGIRPTWYEDDRHEEETLPADVGKGGASDAVCGSPVTKSKEPEKALERVLGEMQ